MFDPTPAAELLLAARHPGERLSAIPPSVAPSTQAEAYAVQDHLVRRLVQDLGPVQLAIRLAAPTRVRGKCWQ